MLKSQVIRLIHVIIVKQLSHKVYSESLIESEEIHQNNIKQTRIE